MAGVGPPPKAADERRRRNAEVAMTRLPAGGRGRKPAPRWPLIPDVVLTTHHRLAEAKAARLEREIEDADPGANTSNLERRAETARERAEVLAARLREQRALEATLWRDLWRTPQAVQWERLGWTRDVAQYVRHKVMAELGDLDSAREARQWSDRLGLTPMAMLRLRWVVAPDELAEKRAEKATQTSAPPAPSARNRIRVVDPGAVAGA